MTADSLQKQQSNTEHLRPLPFLGVESPFGRALFYLRIFFDLRLNAIYFHAKKLFPAFSGRVLDIGCGGQPWRWMLKGCRYTGLEIRDANEKFGYKTGEGLVYYNGSAIPFLNESFDNIVCTEVLEHVPDVVGFLTECRRCLKTGGMLFVTVPFSARYHYIPYDFWRFTPAGLEVILLKAGFTDFKITNLGTDMSAIINKINLLILKQLLSASGTVLVRLVKIIIGFLCLPVFLVLTLLGLLLIRLKVGSPDDPLGYEIITTK